MIHQVPADLVAGVGSAGRQQDPRILDPVRREHHDASRRAVLGAVRPLVPDPRNPFLLGIDVELCDDRLRSQNRASGYGLLDVDNGFVPRLDRTQWHAGGMPIAFGTTRKWSGVDRVWYGIDLQMQAMIGNFLAIDGFCKL